MQEEISLVFKRDALGRVRVTRERRAAVVAEFNRSGLSGAQFARLAGMKYPTLMAWVSRGKRVSPAGAPARQSPKRTRLVEAVIAPPEKTAAVVLHLGGGVCLELTEAGQIPLEACLSGEADRLVQHCELAYILDDHAQPGLSAGGSQSGPDT